MDEIVEQEIAAPVTEEVGQPQTIESEQDQLQVQPKEDVKDRQWRELRKSRDELERKSAMQEELLQRLLSQQMVQPNSQKAQEIEEDIIAELSKEDYASGEKVAKSLRKIEQKYEKKLAEIETKYKQTAYNDEIAELKRDYPDLEDVVNPETLKTFAEKNPRLAKTWQGKDDYTIYVQAYSLIKNSGVLDDVKGARRAKEVDKKIEQNKKTIQSPQAFYKRPMAQAFDSARLSQSQKEDLNREMQQYASLASGVPPIG